MSETGDVPEEVLPYCYLEPVKPLRVYSDNFDDVISAIDQHQVSFPVCSGTTDSARVPDDVRVADRTRPRRGRVRVQASLHKLDSIPNTNPDEPLAPRLQAIQNSPAEYAVLLNYLFAAHFHHAALAQATTLVLATGMSAATAEPVIEELAEAHDWATDTRLVCYRYSCFPRSAADRTVPGQIELPRRRQAAYDCVRETTLAAKLPERLGVMMPPDAGSHAVTEAPRVRFGARECLSAKALSAFISEQSKKEGGCLVWHTWKLLPWTEATKVLDGLPTEL